MEHTNQVCDVLARLVGSRPVAFKGVSGGYTNARRSLVEFADGSRYFVKASVDPLTAGWLRSEHQIYRHVRAPFMPKLVGWDDDGADTVLVLEDLSGALWSRTWDDERIARVISTLDAVHRTTPPSAIPSLESMRADLSGWKAVAQDPGPFLSLGVCSPSWLEDRLPLLVAAEENAVLSGTDLLHLDVRSDNLCFAGDTVKLIDWNWAAVGNGLVDLVFWLPSLRLEGGPPPESLLPGQPELVAMAAGYWAARAGLAEPHSGSQVRQIQTKLLSVALPWCARALELPAPEAAAA